MGAGHNKILHHAIQFRKAIKILLKYTVDNLAHIIMGPTCILPLFRKLHLTYKMGLVRKGVGYLNIHYSANFLTA